MFRAEIISWYSVYSSWLASWLCVNDVLSLQACKECLADFGMCWPTVVDSPSNDFHQTYACWPIRFYCIKDDKLEIVARPNCDTGYDLNEIAVWIQSTVGASAV